MFSYTKSRDSNQFSKAKHSRFKQQEIYSYPLVLSARNVAPIFCVIAILLFSMAALARYLSIGVKQQSVDYTDCYTNVNDNCADILRNSTINITHGFNIYIYISYYLTLI